MLRVVEQIRLIMLDLLTLSMTLIISHNTQYRLSILHGPEAKALPPSSSATSFRKKSPACQLHMLAIDWIKIAGQVLPDKALLLGAGRWT